MMFEQEALIDSIPGIAERQVNILELQLKFRKTPWYLIIVFLLLTIGIGAAGYLHYKNQKESIKFSKQEELSAIADLKVNQIVNWRKEHLENAQAIFENPFINPRIQQLLENPRDLELRQDIFSWLAFLRNNYQYESILLLDSQENVRLAVPSENTLLGTNGKSLAIEAMNQKKVILSDLYKSSEGNFTRLSLLVPILAPQGSDKVPVGVLLFRINPYEYLYPLIQSWPTPSRTAETTLVHREGNDVVFLNELRHREDTALSLHFPLSGAQLPAAIATRGKEGIAEGFDYRGVPVLAAMRSIPDSPWFLVAKVDTGEVYASVRERAWLTIFLAVTLIVSAGIILGLLWHRKHLHFYRKQYETELERRTLSQRYKYLSKYANDIILMIDQGQKIVEANERAVASYRYTHEELLQLSMRDLRSLEAQTSLNAQMRKAEDQDGAVYETSHKRKDGTTFPVEVSSRVVEIKEKKYYQAVIRDITKRKEMEKRINFNNTLLSLFTQKTSRQEYLNAVQNLIHEWSGCSCVGIRVLDNEGNIPYETHVGFSEDFYESENWLSIKKHQCICIGVISGKTDLQETSVTTPFGSFFCNNLFRYFSELSERKQAEFRGMCLRCGFASVAIIPIKYRGKSVGAIHFTDEREGRIPLSVVEFIESVSPIIGEALQRFSVEEELKRNYDTQNVINNILILSQKEITLDSLLKHALSQIISIPWLAFESSGSISLVEDEPSVLIMKVQNGLEEHVLHECSKIPFGKCLCGKAAATGNIQFADSLDNRHEVWFEKITPHGHYCVPILSASKVLGVLNLYVREGHRRNQVEEDFLIAISNTLASIVQRKLTEGSLRESEASLANAQRIARIGNWDWNIVKNELRWSDEIYRIFGLEPQEFGDTYEAFLNFIHPEDRGAVTLAVNKALNERITYSIDHRIVLTDGAERIVHEQAIVLFDDVGKAIRMFGTVQDITERKRAEQNLRAAQQQLLDIIDFLPDATFVIDRDKKVIAWNRAIEEMTGVCKESILGKGDYAYAIPFYGTERPILIDLILLEDNEIKFKYDYIQRKVNTIMAEAFVPQTYEGKGAYLRASASPLFDHNGNIVGAIETIRDINERKRMEDQLHHQATHDYLTGIPNRYSLEGKLKQAIEKARNGDMSAVLFLDLDNFKIVNDTLGHAAGDEFLISLANIIKNNLKEGEHLFRPGGDEFAVLLEGTTAEEAGCVAEKLRKMVYEGEICLTLYQTCFNLTVSIGIVMVDGTLDPQKILAFADTALYSAKDKGRNRVVLMRPDEDISVRLSEANQLVGLIKNALKENRFVLYFQPVVNLRDGKTTHHEALLRLRKEDGEVILPGRFIPIAESFGLMSQIDHWVVEAALKAMCERSDLNLYINLSGSSLSDENLLEIIENKINESGLDHSRIGFEITETAAVRDLVRVELWISRIKKLGCSFALDDFGIGFSSFTYLRMLSVDYLKIDGSFVRNLNNDPSQRALVQAMNEVAHALGKRTIAEFVENEGIIKILEELGIDCGQGYHLGKPAPLLAV